MSGRTYGELDPALRWSCGYMAHPTDPACMAPARWHGILPVDRDCAMASCDEHVAVMRLSADYVHDMGSACFLPGAKFDPDENECWMPGGLLVEQCVAAASVSA